MIRVGCWFVILILAALFVVVSILPVIPAFNENETLDNLLTPLLCQAGEHIERDQYTRNTNRSGVSYSMNAYCVNEEGDSRDETGRWIIISVGLFIVPLLMAWTMRKLGQMRTSMQTVTLESQPGAYAAPQWVTTTPAAGPTMSERLKQLDEARNQGLISADEYDRMRKEILDKGV